jgi:hypothetical protein
MKAQEKFMSPQIQNNKSAAHRMLKSPNFFSIC